jgi:hypothetical protein
MSAMEPSTVGQPPVSEPPSTDADETFFKTPNAPPGFHFEQETVPCLLSGPILPESVTKLFLKLFRRKDTPTAS